MVTLFLELVQAVMLMLTLPCHGVETPGLDVNLDERELRRPGDLIASLPRQRYEGWVLTPFIIPSVRPCIRPSVHPSVRPKPSTHNFALAEQPLARCTYLRLETITNSH